MSCQAFPAYFQVSCVKGWMIRSTHSQVFILWWLWVMSSAYYIHIQPSFIAIASELEKDRQVMCVYLWVDICAEFEEIPQGFSEISYSWKWDAMRSPLKLDPWPLTLDLQKSNQFILESKWTFAPNLNKSPWDTMFTRADGRMDNLSI